MNKESFSPPKSMELASEIQEKNLKKQEIGD
jgi:hypothetical protein